MVWLWCNLSKEEVELSRLQNLASTSHEECVCLCMCALTDDDKHEGSCGREGLGGNTFTIKPFHLFTCALDIFPRIDVKVIEVFANSISFHFSEMAAGS